MNTTNRAFWRAMHSLAHPVSITAVLLLLFNDHYLRHQHPSWLTGKLGDFAWLVFAPFIAAMFFAVILPCWMKQHERITGIAAFVSIGLWFALAKTVPTVLELTTSAWNMLIGWRGSLRMDVTDLLTLPALLIGWYIWRNASNTAINLRPVAYVAFGLGLVGTLASDAATFQYIDYGVAVICRDNDRLIALSRTDETETRFIHVSTDGGFTWKSETMPVSEKLPCAIESVTREIPVRTLSDAGNPAVQYRWMQGDIIERSNDGGQTWQLDRDLKELKQDVRQVYNHKEIDSSYYNGTIIDYRISPVSAFFDPETGHVLFAMSQDGILIRKSSGVWQWVAVGAYRLADLELRDGIYRALLFHQYLAVTLCFLVLTSTTALIRRVAKFRQAWLITGWIGWITLVMFSKPGVSETDFSLSHVETLALFSAVPLLFLVAIPLSLGAIWDVARNFRQTTPYILIVSVLANAAFLFPFLLWSVGTVPRYYTAALFSVLMTGTVLYAAYVFYKPRLPQPEKEKRKNEETLVEAKPEA